MLNSLMNNFTKSVKVIPFVNLKNTTECVHGGYVFVQSRTRSRCGVECMQCDGRRGGGSDVMYRVEGCGYASTQAAVGAHRVVNPAVESVTL